MHKYRYVPNVCTYVSLRLISSPGIQLDSPLSTTMPNPASKLVKCFKHFQGSLDHQEGKPYHFFQKHPVWRGGAGPLPSRPPTAPPLAPTMTDPIWSENNRPVSWVFPVVSLKTGNRGKVPTTVPSPEVSSQRPTFLCHIHFVPKTQFFSHNRPSTEQW